MSRKIFTFWFILLPTLLLCYASLYLSLAFRYRSELSQASWIVHFQAFTPVFILWLLVFFIHGLFETAAFRRYTGLMFKLISATTVNSVLASLYFYFQPNLTITPRRILLLLILIAFLLILAWYLLLKYVLKNRLGEGIYLLSGKKELVELKKAIEEHSYLGYKILGQVDSLALDQAKIDKNSSIILPDNIQANPKVAEKLYLLRTSGVKFYNYKDFYEQLLRKVYLSELNEAWFLENINYQEKRFYNLVKRFTDIAFGFIGMLFFLLSFPFVALLIKFTSSGDILFVQQRVGKGGGIFKVYKYRTMNAWGPTNTWTSVNDPRITKLGKFLRKSRIDEWPQFINLLLGHMSLVGPRPEQPNIVEELKRQIPFYEERHLVKPGITGWAQINNIYAASLEETKEKLQYDLYYIKNRSFLFDLEIILKTVYYIFTWKGR